MINQHLQHMIKPIITTNRTQITGPSIDAMDEFIERTIKSQKEHSPWVFPPKTKTEFLAYLEEAQRNDMESFWVREKESSALIGVFNLRHIVYGGFQNAYLGFYCFTGYERRGLMQEALGAIINFAFYQLALHRIEANIQPDNFRSEKLVLSCGFIKEGFSKHYLKINGKWTDHNRYAITKEQLQAFYIEKANQKEKPWEADFSLTMEEVKTNIHQILKAPIETIERYSEGWDNVVYLVNNAFIFRMPRRYIAIPLIENENKVLSLLHGNVNLAIPNPTAQGFGDSHYPYPIQGYQKLAGEPAENLHLTDEERTSNLEAFAHFLRAIHDIPMATLLAHDIHPQIFNRTDVGLMTNQFHQRIKQLTEQAQVCFNHEVIDSLSKIALNTTFNSEDSCLVHGDLYCRHFLFNQGKLSGIIDWGDTGINHFVVDLAALYSFFPKASHQKFYEIYGDVPEVIRQYAAFLGAYSTVACLDYALSHNNKHLETEARRALAMQNLSTELGY